MRLLSPAFLSAATTFAHLLLQLNPVSSAFVHTSGTKILDENGVPLFFSGINLGNWLVWEGYLMMGDFNYRTHTQFFNEISAALGGDDKAEEFEYQWRMNYVDEKAISDLKELGFNSVRVPFNFKLFYKNNMIVDDGFEFFDRVISFCRTRGMYVLLDMHGAPGYQNPGDHADNVDSNANQPRHTVKFWDGDNVALAASIWKHIASRYVDEPVVWGYDLFNEPVPQPGREYELLPSLITIRDAIREVDNNHIIVAEGSWWSSDLTKIDWTDPMVQSITGYSEQWDDNLVYQLHHYGPASGTFGREVFAEKLNIPVFIGEYGETDEANLKAITDWAKERLEGYFPWSFKKMSHDRCLWTIPPNQAYNEVKNFINNGGTPPTHLYDEMIEFAQVNIKNGHASHEWHNGFYQGVKPTVTCTESAAFFIPGTIQAEEYCGSFGVQTESTTDSGGGTNIGFLDGGDYTEYKVDVTTSGQYMLSTRVASQQGGGLIDVQVDGVSVAILQVPNTNGWQSWTTIYADLVLTSGEHIMKLAYPSGNFNLNWFSFSEGSGNVPTPKPTAASETGCTSASAFAVPGQFEAEAFCNGFGMETEKTNDAGGGLNIGFLDAGDYAEYNINVASAGQYSFEARVASENANGKMDVKLNGNILVQLSIPNTNGWQYWTTISSSVDLPTGEHKLRLDFPEGGFNINWIKFNIMSATPLPTNAPSAAVTTSSDLIQCLATNADLQAQNTHLQAQITELKKQLEQYQSSPSQLPTAGPTPLTPPPIPPPTMPPTTGVTPSPTNAPTKEPTTSSPTKNLTLKPTNSPTPNPLKSPTHNPTFPPTPTPTAKPVAPTGTSLDCSSAPNFVLPVRFEAENFCSQVGITVRDGKLTNISNGDYVEYNIQVPIGSQYTFSANVNSAVYSGQFNLQVNGNSVLWLSVPHTNGAWRSIMANVWLNPGTVRLRVAFPQGGFSIDWMSFGSGSNNPFSR